MKSDAERGRWGRFLRRERLRRGLSQEQVRARLRAERDFAVGESSYAEWESGYKQPTKDAQRHFRALWKADPEPEPAAPEPPTDMAMAIAALVSEVRLSRIAQETTAQALGELAGLVGRLLTREGTQGGRALAGDDGTRGDQ